MLGREDARGAGGAVEGAPDPLEAEFGRPAFEGGGEEEGEGLEEGRLVVGVVEGRREGLKVEDGVDEVRVEGGEEGGGEGAVAFRNEDESGAREGGGYEGRGGLQAGDFAGEGEGVAEGRDEVRDGRAGGVVAEPIALDGK